MGTITIWCIQWPRADELHVGDLWWCLHWWRKKLFGGGGHAMALRRGQFPNPLIPTTTDWAPKCSCPKTMVLWEQTVVRHVEMQPWRLIYWLTLLRSVICSVWFMKWCTWMDWQRWFLPTSLCMCCLLESGKDAAAVSYKQLLTFRQSNMCCQCLTFVFVDVWVVIQQHSYIALEGLVLPDRCHAPLSSVSLMGSNVLILSQVTGYMMTNKKVEVLHSRVGPECSAGTELDDDRQYQKWDKFVVTSLAMMCL